MSQEPSGLDTEQGRLSQAQEQHVRSNQSVDLAALELPDWRKSWHEKFRAAELRVPGVPFTMVVPGISEESQ